jgi:hypothetical protein
VSIDKW